jgi:hypothetical protein
MSLSKDKTYVYEGVECVWTGREAVNRKPTSMRVVVSVVYEISPADPDIPTWKKWVTETDLYEVV